MIRVLQLNIDQLANSFNSHLEKHFNLVLPSTVTGMGKHLDAKNTMRRINLQENAVKRSMTASTTDSSATRPSGRR